ncbi:MAG: hypothetical protein MHM6MM_000353 [Cercozoa sp. M6MM]
MPTLPHVHLDSLFELLGFFNFQEVLEHAASDLSDDDLMSTRTKDSKRKVRKSDKLLSTYTREELLQALEGSGMLAELQRHGYAHLDLRIDVSDPFVHRLVLTDESLAGQTEQDRNILDGHFRRQNNMRFSDLKLFDSNNAFPVRPQTQDFLNKEFGDMVLNATVIEFLRLQNPRAPLDQSRALPGQLHPGLGVFRTFTRVMVSAALRSKRDCLLNHPDFFHNAYINSAGGCVFVNPDMQALFEILVRDLEPVIQKKGLGAVSFACSRGDIVALAGASWLLPENTLPDRPDSNTFVWPKHQEQIFPIAPTLVSKFSRNSAYRRRVDSLIATLPTKMFMTRAEFEKMTASEDAAASTTLHVSSSSERHRSHDSDSFVDRRVRYRLKRSGSVTDRLPRIFRWLFER